VTRGTSDPGPASPGNGPAATRDAQQLADALRFDVAVRTRLAVADEGDDGARLAGLGDLEALSPVAKPGIGAPAIRTARKVLQVFMRPWLAAQTIFNREVTRRYQSVAMPVRDLERRTPQIERSVQQLEARILALEERAAEDPPSRGIPAASRPPSRPIASLDTSTIEWLFVQMRLPPPPARVLLLGSAAAALEPLLERLGFDVAVRGGAHAGSSGAGGADVERADLIVWLKASEPDVAAAATDCSSVADLLEVGGRVLMSDHAGGSGAGPAARVFPLALVDVVVRRGDTMWVARPAVGDGRHPSDAAAGDELFIEARLPDAAAG
jgi:hypothetical protein